MPFDRIGGICQPSMGFSGTLCTAGPATRCHSGPDITAVAWYPGLSPAFGQSEAPPQTARPHDHCHASPTEGESVGCMVHLRRSYQGSGVSEEAVSLLMASWRGSTTKDYNSSWRVWERWCTRNGTHSFSPSVGDIANFLAAEFHAGKGYRSLSYRSALSSTLPPIQGFDVGRHPLVCRILRGVFHGNHQGQSM